MYSQVQCQLAQHYRAQPCILDKPNRVLLSHLILFTGSAAHSSGDIDISSGMGDYPVVG